MALIDLLHRLYILDECNRVETYVAIKSTKNPNKLSDKLKEIEDTYERAEATTRSLYARKQLSQYDTAKVMRLSRLNP